MRVISVLASIFAWLTLLVPVRSAEPFPGIDPLWILIHEPAVIAELKFTPAERKAFQKLTDELDLRVFPLRNKSRDIMLPGLNKAFEDLQAGLKNVLSKKQYQRLNEIYMRRLGTNA